MLMSWERTRAPSTRVFANDVRKLNPRQCAMSAEGLELLFVISVPKLFINLAPLLSTR